MYSFFASEMQSSEKENANKFMKINWLVGGKGVHFTLEPTHWVV